MEANKPNTGVILKEIEENGEKFKVILRVKVESDPAEYETPSCPSGKLVKPHGRRM